MKFTKMHGIGNDFIVIDGINNEISFDINQFALKACDRHFGIGADGVLLISSSDVADIKMSIFNSDGTEAEMCGNGIRCFAGYVYENGIVNKDTMTVETKAGIITPTVILENGKPVKVSVDMGEPILDPAKIPIDLNVDRVLDYEIVVYDEVTEEDLNINISGVSFGNPHCVTYWDKILNAPVESLGKIMESYHLFPKKINVEFVEVINRSELSMKVFERGCGITLACGTGASAAFVASVLNGYVDKEVTIHLAGGDLEFKWLDNNHVIMTGAMTTVYIGEIINI